MFQLPFPRTIPIWLKGLTGGKRRGLELDGYNETAAIAFEYQGLQHYEPVAIFDDSKGALPLQERDAIKRRACWEQKVALIIIPTFREGAGIEAMVNQVEVAVLSAGLGIPKGWHRRRPTDMAVLWTPPPADKPIPSDVLDDVAMRGGVCLSVAYRGTNDKIQLRCQQGHEWSAEVGNIRKGTWCRQCLIAGRRGSIDDAHVAAATRGGRVVSGTYVNNASLLEFQCGQGHRWFATTNSVKNAGSWCSTCSRPRIESAYTIAARRSGKCWSTDMSTTKAILQWECAQGHNWQARFSHVHNGSWCPKCARIASRGPRAPPAD